MSDEDNSCPLCLDELSKADRKFRPCPCGYQICVFCFERIRESESNKCPACRKTYDSENFANISSDEEEEESSDDDSEDDRRNRRKYNSNSSTANSLEYAKRGDKPLNTVRVIQRNLVYVTNLALSIAKPELLKKNEYFGQYGKILKIVINKNNIYNVNSPHGACVSAYITYQRKEDALVAIQTIDGATIEGRVLRASFGTTKYCSYFLRKLPCNNPDCMYLHELGQEDDSYSKEDITSNAVYKPKPNQPTWKDSSDKVQSPTSLSSSTSSTTNSTSLSSSTNNQPALNVSFKTWNIQNSSPQTTSITSALNPLEWPSANDAVSMAAPVSTSPPLSKSQERPFLPATASWGSSISKPIPKSYQEDFPEPNFDVKTKKKDLKKSSNTTPVSSPTSASSAITEAKLKQQEEELRKERERLERERLERERLEKERLEKERLEREKQERLENERLEREKLHLQQEKERLEREKERLEREKLEKEKRLERERQEKERLEKERQLERERIEKEKQEREKQEKEKQKQLKKQQQQQQKQQQAAAAAAASTTQNTTTTQSTKTSSPAATNKKSSKTTSPTVTSNNNNSNNSSNNNNSTPNIANLDLLNEKFIGNLNINIEPIANWEHLIQDDQKEWSPPTNVTPSSSSLSSSANNTTIPTNNSQPSTTTISNTVTSTTTSSTLPSNNNNNNNNNGSEINQLPTAEVLEDFIIPETVVSTEKRSRSRFEFAKDSKDRQEGSSSSNTSSPIISQDMFFGLKTEQYQLPLLSSLHHPNGIEPLSPSIIEANALNSLNSNNSNNINNNGLNNSSNNINSNEPTLETEDQTQQFFRSLFPSVNIRFSFPSNNYQPPQSQSPPPPPQQQQQQQQRSLNNSLNNTQDFNEFPPLESSGSSIKSFQDPAIVNSYKSTNNNGESVWKSVPNSNQLNNSGNNMNLRKSISSSVSPPPGFITSPPPGFGGFEQQPQKPLNPPPGFITSPPPGFQNNNNNNNNNNNSNNQFNINMNNSNNNSNNTSYPFGVDPSTLFNSFRNNNNNNNSNINNVNIMASDFDDGDFMKKKKKDEMQQIQMTDYQQIQYLQQQQQQLQQQQQQQMRLQQISQLQQMFQSPQQSQKDAIFSQFGLMNQQTQQQQPPAQPSQQPQQNPFNLFFQQQQQQKANFQFNFQQQPNGYPPMNMMNMINSQQQQQQQQQQPNFIDFLRGGMNNDDMGMMTPSSILANESLEHRVATTNKELKDLEEKLQKTSSLNTQYYR